jgi:hypothetical protein
MAMASTACQSELAELFAVVHDAGLAHSVGPADVRWVRFTRSWQLRAVDVYKAPA